MKEHDSSDVLNILGVNENFTPHTLPSIEKIKTIGLIISPTWWYSLDVHLIERKIKDERILSRRDTKKLRIKTVCVNLKVCLVDEENKSSVVCIHKYSQYSLITLGDTKVLSKESHTGFTAWSIFMR